jgi:hypothetical protein
MTPGAAHHVLSFHWQGFEPHVVAWDAAARGMVELELSEMDMLVTTARRCVGSFDGDDYFPCPSARRVSGPFAQCPQCAGPRVPDQRCTFEPKCDGSLCGARFCSREHTVYIAFHGASPKVGMCGGHRVAERLTEQGADAYSIVARASNRLEARRVESALSKNVGVRQRVASKDSLANLALPQPWDSIEAAWSAMLAKVEACTGQGAGGLLRLDRYPLAQPLASAPRLRITIGPHQGRAVGLKGRHLVYENDGLNALDASDLPSRVVRLAD